VKKSIFGLNKNKNMDHSTIAANIQSFVEKTFCAELSNFMEQVSKGELYDFEESLWELMSKFYNLVAGEITEVSAILSQKRLRQQAGKLRLGKLEERDLSVQLRTGHYVKVKSLYAKKVPRGYSGQRHLLALHWKLLKGASPAYYSQVGQFSVLCPSFEVACHILTTQGIAHNRDRVQQLSKALAKHCRGRQASLTRAKGETLRGKRVLIGIDGGRTRMRQYKGQKNQAGNAMFSTPWMEPKLFVIDVLDDNGQIERSELPIYGCLFGDDEIVDLLVDHLKGLDIQHAKQVQIVADGAVWIWNRLKDRLLALGVAEEKIVETVDYYHASQYVHKLVGALPNKQKKDAAKVLKSFKQWLWEGNIEAIVKKCRQYFKRPNKEVNQYIGYLDKNKERMKYAEIRHQKLVLGSGIVESGVRRVINLRFKNASSFWKPDNVEGLYFLRGILLSFRWNILMHNLVAA
jgi:hypothetical protein